MSEMLHSSSHQPEPVLAREGIASPTATITQSAWAAIHRLETATGHQFKDPLIALRSVTLHSHSPLYSNYQTYEFLGDRVLSLSTSELILKHGARMASLSASEVREAAFTSNAYLATVAAKFGFDTLQVSVQLSGEVKTHKPTTSQSADIVESILGGIFLDGGYKAVHPLTSKILLSHDSLAHKVEKLVGPGIDAPSRSNLAIKVAQMFGNEHIGGPYMNVLMKKLQDPAHQREVFWELEHCGLRCIDLIEAADDIQTNNPRTTRELRERSSLYRDIKARVVEEMRAILPFLGNHDGKFGIAFLGAIVADSGFEPARDACVHLISGRVAEAIAHRPGTSATPKAKNAANNPAQSIVAAPLTLDAAPAKKTALKDAADPERMLKDILDTHKTGKLRYSEFEKPGKNPGQKVFVCKIFFDRVEGGLGDSSESREAARKEAARAVLDAIDKGSLRFEPR